MNGRVTNRSADNGTLYCKRRSAKHFEAAIWLYMAVWICCELWHLWFIVNHLWSVTLNCYTYFDHRPLPMPSGYIEPVYNSSWKFTMIKAVATNPYLPRTPDYIWLLTNSLVSAQWMFLFLLYLLYVHFLKIRYILQKPQNIFIHLCGRNLADFLYKFKTKVNVCECFPIHWSPIPPYT